MQTSPDTSQVLFRHEYEHELESWLRRRFGWLCLVFLGLGAFKLLWRGISLLALLGGDADPQLIAATAVAAVEGAASASVAAVFYRWRHRCETRDDMLRAAVRMILILGAVSLASRFIVERLGLDFYFGVLMAIFAWHFTACLFLPWTPRDSLRPVLPLWTAWAAHKIFIEAGTGTVDRFVAVMFSPAIVLPGLAIAAWRLRRHSRQFRSVMLGRLFRTMRQEYGRARVIHESLFPDEYDDGSIRVQYTYQPMRELGGDFLHLRPDPDGRLHLVLIDVTGHGLAAALTVNRLYGELERIRGESPRARPGEVVALLNRYVRLTMAPHNIYATAVALCVDPAAGELRWASAGHPPAFLRGANGVVRDLGSTAMLLGAAHEGDFESGEEAVQLAPGDMVVAYTDGAYEARGRDGRPLGLDDLRELLRRRPAPGNWPQFIAASVERYRDGRPDDDVLIATISFVAPGAPRPVPAAAVAAP